MRLGLSQSKLTAISVVIVVVVIATAAVLGLRPAAQPATNPSASRPFSQTSTTTEYVFTDILSKENLSEAITVRVNEVFVIHLAANTGSTGYDWNVSASSGVRFLSYTTTKAGTLPGAPSERDYLFQAAAPGEATITLVYGRLPPAFSVAQVAVTIRINVAVNS
jgi:predicted secreted protein